MNRSIARNRDKSGDAKSGQTMHLIVKEKTLETGDRVELKDIDLTREAVFNMCQIYEACGSEHLARQLLYQYSVVWQNVHCDVINIMFFTQLHVSISLFFFLFEFSILFFCILKLKDVILSWMFQLFINQVCI